MIAEEISAQAFAALAALTTVSEKAQRPPLPQPAPSPMTKQGGLLEATQCLETTMRGLKTVEEILRSEGRTTLADQIGTVAGTSLAVSNDIVKHLNTIVPVVLAEGPTGRPSALQAALEISRQEAKVAAGMLEQRTEATSSPAATFHGAPYSFSIGMTGKTEHISQLSQVHPTGCAKSLPRGLGSPQIETETAYWKGSYRKASASSPTAIYQISSLPAPMTESANGTGASMGSETKLQFAPRAVLGIRRDVPEPAGLLEQRKVAASSSTTPFKRARLEVAGTNLKGKENVTAFLPAQAAAGAGAGLLPWQLPVPQVAAAPQPAQKNPGRSTGSGEAELAVVGEQISNPTPGASAQPVTAGLTDTALLSEWAHLIAASASEQQDEVEFMQMNGCPQLLVEQTLRLAAKNIENAFELSKLACANETAMFVGAPVASPLQATGVELGMGRWAVAVPMIDGFPHAVQQHHAQEATEHQEFVHGSSEYNPLVDVKHPWRCDKRSQGQTTYMGLVVKWKRRDLGFPAYGAQTRRANGLIAEFRAGGGNFFVRAKGGQVYLNTDEDDVLRRVKNSLRSDHVLD